MPRRKKIEMEGGLQIQEVSIEEARRHITKSRSRGSKYDALLSAAEKLEPGKALVVGQVAQSEITAIRQRIKSILGGEWVTEAARSDREKNLYDMIVHRK